jgi:hypothetical protein
MWSNKTWIHCSKCLGPFRHATDFWRIGKCYVSYKFLHIANISETRVYERNTKSLTTFEMWSEIFEFVRSECISLRNIQLISEFSFTIPGTRAALERVFPITNALWTDEKSRFLVDTIKAATVTKNTFWGTFVQRLLYFDFRQSQITSRNSLIYEVQDICPRGKKNSFNIKWK